MKDRVTPEGAMFDHKNCFPDNLCRVHRLRATCHNAQHRIASHCAKPLRILLLLHRAALHRTTPYAAHHIAPRHIKAAPRKNRAAPRRNSPAPHRAALHDGPHACQFS